ncbi:PREDICTED: uncharacterized protein LOC104586447 [Nelumbo nucifera]|uniref:Uncharacterized protein LOC104586447 n=1 Tax=Nelumbo nucifera TaxID=4432 RepID=A0A1U8Q083_NELNU|nr:PREDICTED: uncharacterized protein LOC104586447 [Nelumbo nucifera]
MEDKVLTTGCKLLALCKNPVIMNDTMKRSDFSSSGIILKVQELLLNCKEIKSSNGDNKEKVKPELSPKWIALSTMEKAFLSMVSLEDMSSTMRRVGGNFKERLQELGGLDSVFDITTNCCSTMEEFLWGVKGLKKFHLAKWDKVCKEKRMGFGNKEIEGLQ